MIVRRAAPFAVLLMIATVANLPAAAAGAGQASTKVIVSLKFPAYHGTLKSSKSACVSGRTVKLYRERSGPDKLLGTDTSSPKGKWSIPIGKRLVSGSYYARAGSRGNCKAGKSKVLVID